MTTENDMEYCCEEPNLCYVHLVKSGHTCKEAREIIEQRAKAQLEMIPEIGPKDE